VKIGRVFTCALPCKEVFHTKMVVIFSFLDAQGKETWAEASPLPARSRETFDEVIDALSALKQGKTLSHIPSSLQFAMDATTLPPLDKPIPISRLLAGSPKQILETAEKLHREGTTCVKVKITGLDIQEEISLLKELKKNFTLRIDANRSLSLQEAMTFASHFDPADPSIEYFEEPLRFPLELNKFPLPFALDESLIEPHLELLLTFANLRALVLKPSVIGGRAACLEWMQRRPDLKCVLSSAFESGIGILQLARLYTSLPSLANYPGLDSYSYLEEDVLQIPLELRGGFLIPPKDFAVRETMLCPI